MWFILQGSVEIIENTKSGNIVANVVESVNACGDIELNNSSRDTGTIIQVSSEAMMISFYLENTWYD